MYLSHTVQKAQSWQATLRKRRSSTPHYYKRIEGKNPTLFHVGAIIANCFMIFFTHAISTYGSWVMIDSSKTCNFDVLWPLSGY